MVENISDNIVAQWGAVGVLVSFLTAGNIVQWKRGEKRDSDYAASTARLTDDILEQSKEQTAALVELVTLVRDRRP